MSSDLRSPCSGNQLSSPYCHGQTRSAQAPLPPNRCNTLGISAELLPSPSAVVPPQRHASADRQHDLPLLPPFPTAPLIPVDRASIRKGRVKTHVLATPKTLNQVVRVVCTRRVLVHIYSRLRCGLCRCQPAWGRARLTRGCLCEGVGVWNTQFTTTRAGERRDERSGYAIPAWWPRGTVRDDRAGVDRPQNTLLALTSRTHRCFHSEAGKLVEIAWVGGFSGNEEGCGGIEATDSKKSRLEDRESKLLPPLSPYPEGFDAQIPLRSYSFPTAPNYDIRYINKPPLFFIMKAELPRLQWRRSTRGRCRERVCF